MNRIAESFGNLTFPEIIKLFTTVAAQFIFPQVLYKGSNFSISSPTLVYFLFFLNYYSHSSEYKVIFHCGFDSRSSDD